MNTLRPGVDWLQNTIASAEKFARASFGCEETALAPEMLVMRQNLFRRALGNAGTFFHGIRHGIGTWQESVVYLEQVEVEERLWATLSAWISLASFLLEAAAEHHRGGASLTTPAKLRPIKSYLEEAKVIRDKWTTANPIVEAERDLKNLFENMRNGVRLERPLGMRELAAEVLRAQETAQNEDLEKQAERLARDFAIAKEE